MSTVLLKTAFSVSIASISFLFFLCSSVLFLYVSKYFRYWNEIIKLPRTHLPLTCTFETTSPPSLSFRLRFRSSTSFSSLLSSCLEVTSSFLLYSPISVISKLIRPLSFSFFLLLSCKLLAPEIESGAIKCWKSRVLKHFSKSFPNFNFHLPVE